MKILSRAPFSFLGNFAAVAVCSAMVSGCYMVPIQHAQVASNQAYAPVAVMAVRPIFTARLYPTNDIAATAGRITGSISNPERGQGEFAFVMGGENFVGEATRAPNASKGTANAAGNRGAYAKCTYTMSNATLGTGGCVFSSGATFDLHISQ
ncbi:MAG: hypothetical protein H7293_06855 [Candidatus Saccharibacteria bacterium]|nr:hypothetical protein [Rhodoferax sp.]